MQRRHLEIAEPCANDWSQMQGTSSVRHCSACSKNVYNLSMLTEREAKAALAVRPANVCIRYHFDASGQVVFYPEPRPGRAHGAQTLAAALAVSAMSACVQPEASASNASPGVTAPVAAGPAQIEVAQPVAKAPPQIAVAPTPTPAPAAVAAAAPTETAKKPAAARVAKAAACDASWDKSFKKKRKTAHLEPYPDLILQGGYPPDSHEAAPPDYVDELVGLPQVPTRVQIIAAFDAVKPAVDACGGTGRAIASVELAGNTGTVASVTVTGVEGALAQCVRNAVRLVRLPRFQKRSFAVLYPFKL